MEKLRCSSDILMNDSEGTSFQKPVLEIAKHDEISLKSYSFMMDRQFAHLFSYNNIKHNLYGGERMASFLSTLALLIKEMLFFVSYIKNNTFPQPLSAKEEQKYLQQMADGNKEARNKLIEHNLRLVAHIVKKFDNTGEYTEDLISIGTIGLIKGVESFKEGKGTKLATYAARCIENEILMYLRTLKKTRKDTSIYSPIGQDYEGNEISLLDVLEADTENIFEYIQLNMEMHKMQEHFSVLTEREKKVLIFRFGLNNEEELTQKEIASLLHISRSYVSRIEKRALMKVFRSYFKKEKQHPYDDN